MAKVVKGGGSTVYHSHIAKVDLVDVQQIDFGNRTLDRRQSGISGIYDGHYSPYDKMKKKNRMNLGGGEGGGEEKVTKKGKKE